jgi:hypothetical protein
MTLRLIIRRLLNKLDAQLDGLKIEYIIIKLKRKK